MKRILYIWQAGYPWDVRVEKICTTLRDAGSEIVILARWKPGQPEREVLDGMTIVRVGYQRAAALSLPVSWNPLWRAAIRRLVEEFAPTLVIPREILLAEAAAAVAHRRGIPVVMDMAEHYPAAMREWKKYAGNPLLRLAVHTLRLPDAVEQRSVQMSDGILTVCDENSERLHRQYNVSYSRIQVVHNTPPAQLFGAVHTGCSEPPVHLAHHGFMTAERGLETLVEGFARVLPAHPSLRLTLAGEGESLEQVRALVQQLSLEGRVALPGRYAHSDLVAMYSSTDLGMVPYWNDEFRNHTIPNKLFDYMACGKPVLVSLSTPLRRIVEETGCGIAADCSHPDGVAEGINRLLGADVRAMSERALHAARTTYNWETDTKHLLYFLQQY